VRVFCVGMSLCGRVFVCVFLRLSVCICVCVNV
jgi:hypothetical protein